MTREQQDAEIRKHYPVSGAYGVSMFTGLTRIQVQIRVATLRKRGESIPAPKTKFTPNFEPITYPNVPYHIRVSDRKQKYHWRKS